MHSLGGRRQAKRHGIFGSADEKIAMWIQRYNIVKQRLLRQDKYTPYQGSQSSQPTVPSIEVCSRWHIP